MEILVAVVPETLKHPRPGNICVKYKFSCLYFRLMSIWVLCITLCVHQPLSEVNGNLLLMTRYRRVFFLLFYRHFSSISCASMSIETMSTAMDAHQWTSTSTRCGWRCLLSMHWFSKPSFSTFLPSRHKFRFGIHKEPMTLKLLLQAIFFYILGRH